jgi:probable F420-dependent oxidoreductase
MAVDVGRIGVWCSSRIWPQDPGAAAEAAAELEELGYQAIWLGISPGNLERPEALLAATSRLAVATGIASVWDSPPGAVAAAYHRVCDTSPGRFLLGLGASHAHVVERGGGTYERPYRKVDEFLDGLDTAALPVPADGRALAALGPRMLALAGRRTAGAHPYLVTPEHTHRAREILGDGPLLAPEQMVVLETDRHSPSRSPVPPCTSTCRRRTTSRICSGWDSPTTTSARRATGSWTHWSPGVTRRLSPAGSPSTTRPAPTMCASRC